MFRLITLFGSRGRSLKAQIFDIEMCGRLENCYFFSVFVLHKAYEYSHL